MLDRTFRNRNNRQVPSFRLMPDYSKVDQDLTAAQARFASALKMWFTQNGWPQKITDDWARDADYPNGPWASQICHLLQGGFEPKSSFWIALQEFNLSVANQEFRNLSDQKLKDRLNKARPFVDDEGCAATAATFFSMFIGETNIPMKYVGFTDDAAQKYSATVAEWFENLVVSNTLPANLAWQKLERELPIEPDPWTDTVKRVALGLKVLKGCELDNLLGGLNYTNEGDPIIGALLKVDRELKGI